MSRLSSWSSFNLSRRDALLGLASLAFPLALAGCSSAGSASGGDGKRASGGQLSVNIGTPVANGDLQENSVIALKKGYLDDDLKTVNAKAVITGFASGPAINDSLAAGKVDLAFMGDVPEIIAAASGLKVKIIGAMNTDVGRAIIVKAGSPIESVKDLKGKKVVSAVGTVNHIYTMRALALEGMTLDDIEVVNDAANGLNLISGGQADAASTSLIQANYLVGKGQAKVISNSLDNPGTSAQLLVMSSQKFLDEHRDAAVEVIRSLRQAKDFAAEHIDEAYKLLTTKDFDLQAIEKTYPRDSAFASFDPKITDESRKNLAEVASYLLKQGNIKAAVDTDALIDESIYDDAAK